MGLTRASAADASLLLNLEAVLTALLAWMVFRESADRRIVLGTALIVAGGIVLAWPSGRGERTSLWAIDNNLSSFAETLQALGPCDEGHQHDSHHQHAHAFAWDGGEPHTHEHRHGSLIHSHPHYPDIHHRHGH